MAGISNPALSYTLEQFVDEGKSDQLTYSNFSVIREINGIKFTSFNILDSYLDELAKICIKIPRENISTAEVQRYKYNPDLLAYDIYGTVQLDFVVMLCNGIVDPKEFDFHNRYLLLPRASVLQEFLSKVYNADYRTLNDSISL